MPSNQNYSNNAVKIYERPQMTFPKTLGIRSSDLFCSNLITDHIFFPLIRFSALVSCPYPFYFSCFCKVLFLLKTVRIKPFFFTSIPWEFFCIFLKLPPPHHHWLPGIFWLSSHTAYAKLHLQNITFFSQCS